MSWLRALVARTGRRARATIPPGAHASPRPPPDKLIVGLGNPGPRYVRTRHNVGFRVLDVLAARHAGGWQRDVRLQAQVCRFELDGMLVVLAQPQTFMNRSGETVEAALETWPGLRPDADLLVVYDDLDLATGRIRLRPSGGAGGHRGIADILDRLGTRDVPRLRFGIGHPGSADRVLDWVLEPFGDDEERDVLPAALTRAADAVEAAVVEGVGPAMGRFNARQTG